MSYLLLAELGRSSKVAANLGRYEIEERREDN